MRDCSTWPDRRFLAVRLRVNPSMRAVLVAPVSGQPRSVAYVAIEEAQNRNMDGERLRASCAGADFTSTADVEAAWEIEVNPGPDKPTRLVRLPDDA